MKKILLISLITFGQIIAFGQIDKSKYVLANSFTEEMRISDTLRDEYGRTYSGTLDEKYDIIFKAIEISTLTKTAKFSFERKGTNNYSDNISVNDFFVIPQENENFFVECFLIKINEKSEEFKTKTVQVKFEIYRDRSVLNRNRLKIEKVSNYYYLDKKKEKKEINKKILILKDTLSKESKILVFKTDLQVNTDGTPISYHPNDLKGNLKAINSIGNAATIKKINTDENLFFTEYSKAISIFEKFRDNGYKEVEGYKIEWDNVLIPEIKSGNKVPCIFKTGEYKGYYSSATSLKNNLKTNKGECECNNQVNPLKIPAFVIPKGTNFVKEQGAEVGDFLVIYNATTNKLVYGVINDEGPKDKLGEGSVFMNMLLLNKDKLPKNKAETYGLVIKEKIHVLLIPKTKDSYKIIDEIYTKENIERRTKKVLSEKFALLNENDIIELFKKYDDQLK